VKVLRRKPPKDDIQIASFDIEAAGKGDAAQDPIVQDGDQIVVSSSDGYVLLGRVRQPGVYYTPGIGGAPLTLSRLVALGGGFETYAKKSAVIIVRKDKPGVATPVDVKSIIEEGKLEKDVPLNPGDMVFVGESAL
jgi:protein involved in polysaccharide export with SLBB domain